MASRMALAAALCLGGAFAAAEPAAALPAAQDARSFDIPAGPLSESLRRYAEITGLQTVYSSELVADLRAPAVRGRYSAEQALALILSGSGLQARQSGETIALERAPARLTADDGSRLLGPVMVEGSQGGRLAGATSVNGVNGSRDVTATEGAGSYTSGALTVGSKAPLSIQDLPQSVSVLTAQRIEDQNISDFTEALTQIPGVSLIQGAGGLDNRFISRGFEIKNVQVDGGAPLIIGLPVPITGTQAPSSLIPQIDLAMYDHVEILRGSTGTLDGYGEPSGTINLVRKKPLDHPQLAIELQAGSWNSYRAVMDATAPLAFDGRLRGRAVMSYQDNEYFYALASDSRTVLYGVLEYDLTPSILVTAGLSQTRQDSLPWYGGLPRYQDGGDIGLPRSTSFAFPWNRSNFETSELFASIEKAFANDWRVKLNLTRISQTNDRKYGYVTGAVHPATGAGPVFRAARSRAASEQTSAELTTFGEFELFGNRHEITAGLSYAASDSGGDALYRGINTGNPPVDIFRFDPDDVRYAEPSDPMVISRTLEGEFAQTGAYINLRLNPTDWIHLAAGARYSRFNSRNTAVQYCFSLFLPGCQALGDVWRTVSGTNENEFHMLPQSASASFDISDSLTAYLGYSDVYVPQPNFLDGDLNVVDPITGTNLEAGLKWEGAEGRRNASISVYRIEQEGFAAFDLDSQVFDPVYGTVDNNGTLHVDGMVGDDYCCYLTGLDITRFSQGVDVEFTGEVIPGWQLSASYTYNDNEWRGDDIDVYFGRTTGLNGQPILSQAPRHLLKIWTSYAFERDDWTRGLTIAGGVNAQSSSYNEGSACTQYGPPDGAGNSECLNYAPFNYTAEGYAVWSARIDYRLTDRWSVSANLNNIFDERYYKTTGSAEEGNWYGEPASYTLTLRARW